MEIPKARVDLRGANPTLFAVRTRNRLAKPISPSGTPSDKERFEARPNRRYPSYDTTSQFPQDDALGPADRKNFMRLPSDPPRENIGMMTAYGRYASLGIQLTASMCVFGWIGYWLDGKLGTRPWLMILGLMLGAGAGFYALILTVNAGMKSEAEARAAKAEASEPGTDSKPDQDK